MRFLFPIIFSFVISAQLNAAGGYVYFAVSGENRIAVYEQDTQSGRLSFSSEAKTNGGPKSLALSPDGKYLYASMQKTETLISYRIDPRSGALSMLSETPGEAHASFLFPDHSGRFLIASYYSLGRVLVHSTHEGKLGSSPLQSINTDDRPHSVAVDPLNRYAFVSHTLPNAIFQFEFDAKTGLLSPNETPLLKREGVVGPRHLRFHANGKFAYGSNEQGSSVSLYRLDSKTGRLATLQTLSTLPEGYTEKNSTSDVRIHPDGSFVYVINRGHDSIATFAIAQETGRLSFIDSAPCESQTRSFVFSGDGRFLYAPGSRTSKVVIYEVDSVSGRLNDIESLEVGPGLWWALFLPRE